MTARTATRTALFLLLAAFILLGPGYRQLAHGRCPLFRPWQMYRNIGLGYCDAVYELRSEDGSRRALTIGQAYAYLGEDLSPSNRFRSRDVLALGRRVQERAGPGAEVRLTARRVGRNGWEPLCADTPVDSIAAEGTP